jgi:hypothetical protein
LARSTVVARRLLARFRVHSTPAARAGPTASPDRAIDRSVTIDTTSALAVVPSARLRPCTRRSTTTRCTIRPTPSALEEAGIRLLRYPGGGYADNYHFSSHELSLFHSAGAPTSGYLADRSDFGQLHVAHRVFRRARE